jgi:hypothetical protein
MQLLNHRDAAVPLQVSSVETDRVIVVRLPAWAVVFPRAPELITEGFTIPASTVEASAAHLLVTGLAAGDWLVISSDGSHRVTISAGEHHLYLDAAQGGIQLEPVREGH